jgi:hypothetical protein
MAANDPEEYQADEAAIAGIFTPRAKDREGSDPAA